MKETSTPGRDTHRSAVVADAALREALARFVRAKVPASEVEDIVQSTLTDAIAAPSAPETDEELRRWVYGIARHKIADHYRREARAPDSVDAEEAPAESVPHSARDLLRWAERELPDGEAAGNTLEWMLREGDGEKLEHIAEERNVAPTQVRQRVSRLRRYFRERWAQQLAAVAAVFLLILAGLWIWSERREPEPRIVNDVPSAMPSDRRAVELRKEAFDHCAAERWMPCLERLDEAKALDPAGDASDEVREWRRRAAKALAPPIAPTTAPMPSASAPAPRPSATAPLRTTEPMPPKAPAPRTTDPSDFGMTK